MISSEMFTKKIILLLITWASFFFSLGLNPLKFFEYNFISQARLTLPFVFFFTLVLFFFNKFKFSKILEIPSIFFMIIFFSYTYFNLENTLNNNINIFWPTYMFLSFFMLSVFTNYIEKFLLLKLSIAILFFVFVFYFLSGTIDSFFLRTNYHFYGIMGSRLGYAGLDDVPRSSGLARLALVLFTFLTLLYIYKNQIKNYKLLFSISFLALISLLFQSRTISFVFLIINCLFIIFYFKKYFLDKRLIFCTFIFPIIINLLYTGYIFKLQNHDADISLFVITKNSLIRNTDHDKFYKKEKFDKFSSGRYNNWVNVYNIFKKNPLKGYGAQADRIYIKNQSVHNAFLYTLLSGGLIAGFSIVLIYLYSIWYLFKYYLLNQFNLLKKFESSFCAFLIIILGLRSLLETSFAVFSIDFLLFILAFSLVKDHLLNNEN